MKENMEEKTEEKIAVEQDVFAKLENFRVTTHLHESAPKSDHEFLKCLEAGEEEHDLKKIYEFIAGYERGSGYVWNEEVCRNVKLAFDQSPKRLLEILEKRKEFIEKYFLISTSSMEMLGYYIKNEQSDPVIVFESLRQMYMRAGKNEYKEEIVYGVVRLAKMDTELWEFWLSKMEYQEKWISYLGEVLGRLDKKELETYAESIHIDISSDRMLMITNAFQAIPEERVEFVLKNIAGILYGRWKEYLLKFKEKGTSGEGLVLSGYINVILLSIYYLFTDEKLWNKEFKKVSREFIDDMFRWYQSQTQLSSYYFTDLTQIYLFLLLGKKEIKIQLDEEIKTEIDQIRELVVRKQEMWRKADSTWKELLELLEINNPEETTEASE